MTARPLLMAATMRAFGVSLSVFYVLLTAGCTSDEVDDGDEGDDIGAADEPLVKAGMDVSETPLDIGELEATTIRVLRGVDRAGVFSVHEARVLALQHGVRWSGVYIGGACNGGFGWTKSRVTQIAKGTNWQFMPIFVGQQSPAICGAHNLTRAQGVKDAKATVKRMRAFGWLPHRDIPVALDVEAGTYFNSPAGSTRYVRGWVNTMHDAGYRAYVYGSPFGLNHWRAANVRIDAAWAASFFFSGFRHVKPGQLDQLQRFHHHNRAWQYAGNFHVNGAGNVDASTSDLLLAPRPGGSNRSTVSARETPALCGTLQAGEGLARGEALSSCDGTTQLALGDDGDLVVRRDSVVVWTADTLGAGVTAVMQDNGELVVFDDEHEPVFTTETGGFPEARATIGADGLAIVGDDGAPLWSGTDGSRIVEPVDLELP